MSELHTSCIEPSVSNFALSILLIFFSFFFLPLYRTQLPSPSTQASEMIMLKGASSQADNESCPNCSLPEPPLDLLTPPKLSERIPNPAVEVNVTQSLQQLSQSFTQSPSIQPDEMDILGDPEATHADLSAPPKYQGLHLFY